MINREQIVKELSMFIEDMPADLHLGFARTVKFRDFLEKALALIRELTEENEQKDETIAGLIDTIKDAYGFAVRKMQERLQDSFEYGEYYSYTRTDIFAIIDQIAKELLEENDG